MEPKKLKRMIYIYEENVEFYDNLPNKSSFINEVLFREQRRQRPDTRIEYVKQKLAEMEGKVAAKGGND